MISFSLLSRFSAMTSRLRILARIILAWLMARHASPEEVPDNPEDFLDQFNTFSIYQILPQLIDLWGLNVQTTVEARKNLAKVSGK